MPAHAATRPGARGLVAVLSLLACAAAHAQSPAQAWFDSRFVVSLGGFAFGTDLEARLNGEVQRSDEVDFDEQFNLGANKRRWRADALWRIAPRHQLRLGYFDIGNSDTRTLDRDIEWGDYTFISGAAATATFDASIVTLSYEYAFVRQPTYEVAAVFGVHYSHVWLSLEGEAKLIDADGNVIDSGVVRKTANSPVPLPLIGLHGSWVVSPHWILNASAALFKAGTGDVDGSWSDVRVGATWMFNQHVGVGATVSRFRTDVEVSQPKFDGSLTFGYSGVQFFVTGTF